MARHVCNHNTQEIETGGSQSQASLDYIAISKPAWAMRQGPVSQAGGMHYENFPNTVKESVLALLPSWQ